MFRKTGPLFETLLVITMAIAAGLVFLDRYGIAFAFPYMKTELKLDYGDLGLLMAATSLAWAISSIALSFLSDMLGGRRRLFIVVSVILFSTVTGLTGLAKSFTMLLIIRALMGMVEGPVIPLMQSTVIACSSPKRLGINLGIVIAGVSLLGGALPPFLIVGMADRFGWRDVFIYLAVPGLIVGGLLWAVMRSDKPAIAPKAVDCVLPAERLMPHRLNRRDIAALFRERNVILAIIGTIAMIGFGTTFASFAPSFLIGNSGISQRAGVLLLTAYGIMGAAGTVIAPALSDRWGRKRILLLSVICTVLLPAALVLLKGAVVLLFLAMLLQLIAGGTMALLTYVIPGESVPRALAATTFAILLSVGEIVGGTTAPAIGGWLADHYGLQASMWLCCILGMISLLVSTQMRDTSTRVRADEGLSSTIISGVT